MKFSVRDVLFVVLVLALCGWLNLPRLMMSPYSKGYESRLMQGWPFRFVDQLQEHQTPRQDVTISHPSRLVANIFACLATAILSTKLCFFFFARYNLSIHRVILVLVACAGVILNCWTTTECRFGVGPDHIVVRQGIPFAYMDYRDLAPHGQGASQIASGWPFDSADHPRVAFPLLLSFNVAFWVALAAALCELHSIWETRKARPQTKESGVFDEFGNAK